MALYLLARFLHPIAIGLIARPDKGALLVVYHSQSQGPGVVVGPLKQTNGAQGLRREGKRENVRRGHQKEERGRRREGGTEEGKELVIDIPDWPWPCVPFWRQLPPGGQMVAGSGGGKEGCEFCRRDGQGVCDGGGDGVGDVAAGG